MKPTDIFNPSQRRPSKAYLVSELHKGILQARAGLSSHNGHPHVVYCSSGLWKTISVRTRLFDSGHFSIPYTKVDKNRNYGA